MKVTVDLYKKSNSSKTRHMRKSVSHIFRHAFSCG
jgi:hypothetical protein